MKGLTSHKPIFLCLLFYSSMLFASSWCEHHCEYAKDMMRVGYDVVRNHNLYACRANLWGSLQIGHTWHHRDRCHLPYAGKVYTVDKFSVLKKIEGKWQPYYGYFPKEAFILGRGANKEKQALCRGYYDHALVPGKTWAGHHSCDIVLRRKVIALKRYAIFIHVSSSDLS